jgi:hypothetical protein
MIIFRSTVIRISILGVLVSACNSPSGIQGNSSQAQPIAINNLCENIYFPVRAGSTWNYTGSTENSGSFSISNSVSEVRADGFTLSTTFDGLSRTQEWSCTAEGLVALTFGDGPAGEISTQGLDLDITTSNILGVSIPFNPKPGDEWNYSLDIGASLMLPDGQTGQAQGRMTTPLKAIGLESVSVPAGTFEALRIESVPTINLTATYLGLPIPVSFKGKVTIWLAPGVGWIKSTERGDFFGTSINSTIELQSFHIP